MLPEYPVSAEYEVVYLHEYGVFGIVVNYFAYHKTVVFYKDGVKHKIYLDSDDSYDKEENEIS